MNTYEVELSRIVLVRQTTTVTVQEDTEENAVAHAMDIADDWRDVKLIISEGYDVEGVRVVST